MENSTQRTCVRDALSQKTCEGAKQNINPMEKPSMEDSSQKTCVRDAHLKKTWKGLKQSKGNLESINEVVFEDHVDFSVSNVYQRTRFMNACIDTPFIVSYISEIELANFDDFNCWPQILSPYDNDVNM